ncbi:hypothetical protein PMIN01_00299 [Paraphaeosphaeria minitans]|uniref:Uncharacterized protein n=1 Tax=Paraphaeosphaeria minitans TaxID=565426 RepID=A0A9P6GTC5_9PLEO|nr:hypothetical protein PMIN01_00299 [Paraphaeosphaeria minitans]
MHIHPGQCLKHGTSSTFPGWASKLCFSDCFGCESAVVEESVGLIVKASRCSISPTVCTTSLRTMVGISQ